MEDTIIICKELGSAACAEIQVIPYGYHKTPKGDFLCDDESARLVLEEFASHKNNMVADYEHQTLDGKEAPAAGWITQLVNKGADGIWARVDWTEKAKAYLANREYRYVSPVFLKRAADNRVVRLINVALTNQPNIDGMVPLVNKGNIARGYPLHKEDIQMKRTLEALGLPEGADDDAASAAVARLKAAAVVVANKAVCEALGLKETAAESEVVGTVMAMKQGFAQTGDLAAKVASLEAQQRVRESTELVAMAMKEGKITSGQQDWARAYAEKDPEGFKVFVAKAAVVVPNGKLPSGAQTERAAATDETQVMVNKMLGISDETFNKHKGEAE